MKKLAICIPNYNRPDDFFRLLNQIIGQIKNTRYNNDIEICISDDGSEFDVTNDVSRIKSENPDIIIKYQRSEINTGMEVNFNTVIQMSDSEYCWMIGNDDILLNDDSIQSAIDILNEYNNPEMLTFPLVVYHNNIITRTQQFTNEIVNRKFNFLDKADEEQWFEYYTPIKKFGDPCFRIFKKSIWIENYGSVTWYTDVFMTAAYTGITIQYYSEKLLIARCGHNDIGYWDTDFLKYYFLKQSLNRSHCFDKLSPIFTDVDKRRFPLRFIDAVMTSNEINQSDKDNLQKLLLKNFSESELPHKGIFLRTDKFSILDNKNIIVFGASYFGALSNEILKKHNYNIYCYVDNDVKKHGTLKDNVKIISFNESLNVSNKIYIIAAYANGAFNSVYSQLKDAGIPESDIYIVI